MAADPSASAAPAPTAVRPPAPDPVTTLTRTRLAWVDATRGLSVVAVVLFHVVLWHYRELEPLGPVAATFWGEVNRALGSARMPVLLAVSGLVLARRVRTGPVRGRVLARSVGLYYLYVVWLGVYALFYAVASHEELRHRVDGPGEVAANLVVPTTTLWYLLALAVYTLALTALRRVHPAVVLSVLAVLAGVVHSLDLPGQLWPKIPQLFVFFALGVYGADLFRRLAERTSPRLLVVGLLASAGVTGLGWVTRGVIDSVLFVPRGAVFAATAVLAVSLAARWRPVERLGSAVGRRTLPIYVVHPLVLALVTLATAGTTVLHPVTSGTLPALLYPAVLTLVVVAVSWAAQPATEALRLHFLWAAPRRLEERVAALGAARPGRSGVDQVSSRATP